MFSFSEHFGSNIDYCSMSTQLATCVNTFSLKLIGVSINLRIKQYTINWIRSVKCVLYYSFFYKKATGEKES